MVAPEPVKYLRMARALGLLVVMGKRCPSEEERVPLPQALGEGLLDLMVDDSGIGCSEGFGA